MNKIDVPLVATLKPGNKIKVTGPPGPFSLGVDTGAWHFDFTLDDRTGKSVEFASLDAEDRCSVCPPTVTGNKSKLISGDTIGPDPTTARFVDNNNNDAKLGVVDVSFQWHFTCDDPAITIDTYDPVVPNGGKS